MNELISLNGISKIYDSKLVLDKIDLSIKENQSIALTGHNGSGKSTLLKIVAGLVKPSAGSITFAHKLLFHYVPDGFPKMNLTIWQYLKRMGEIDGLASEKEKEKIECLSEDFFLRDMLHSKMSHLSKGTLQKVGVIQALLTKPDVLLLDEPLSGQDLDSQRVFISKINELRNDNVTILMSCHERYLIEQITDTVYGIDNRKLHPVNRERELVMKEYMLWFESDRNVNIPEKYRDYIKMDGKKCNAMIPEKLCNEMILQMIHQGWSLRRMADAKDERTGEISLTTVF